MRKYLITALLSMLMLVSMVPTAFAADSNYTECMTAISEQKEIQKQAHSVATLLREQGYSDDNVYIQAAKSLWNDAQKEIEAYERLSKYTDEDIRILATMVYYEAGQTTEELRQYVARVAVNRTLDSRFPSTIKGVITQPGQYAGQYATVEATKAIQDSDAANGTHHWSACVSSAKMALMGKVDMPNNVIFQANFTQGSGVWKALYFDSGWFSSTSYFCYG